MRGASAEDTVLQEAVGGMQGLFRDLTTPRGLPLANWDKGAYDQVSGYMQSQFGVPKGWFYDVNSYDAAEVIGASAGVLALIFCWNRSDSEELARLAGGLGLAAALGANPLLLIVTVAAVARALQKSRLEGSAAGVVDGLFRGSATAAASLGSAALVTVLGGPAGLALLVGLAAGVLAVMAVSHVSVAEVAQYAAGQAKRLGAYVSQSVFRPATARA